MASGKGQATFEGAVSGGAKGKETGSKIGKPVGAALGMAFGLPPSVGGAIGEKAGGAMGMGIGATAGGIRANKQANELEKARNIQAEDPEQRRDLELSRQRLKSYQTGSAADTQAEMQGVGQNVKAGLSAYAKVGGPGTLAGMTQMLKAGQQGINQAQIGGLQQAGTQQKFVRSLGDFIAQRRLEVAMLRKDDAEFDTAEQQNVAGANAMAALGSGGGEGGQGGSLSDMMKKAKGLAGGGGAPSTSGGATPGVSYKNPLTGGGSFGQSTNFGGSTPAFGSNLGMTGTGGGDFASMSSLLGGVM
jgi:hypothetical protein